MRPIDAHALLPNNAFYVNESNPMTSLDELLKRIVEAPTLDYAPVVHGEWIEDDTLFTRQRKCSICGKCDNPKTAIRGHFCWYCGALMDGGKKDG